MRRGAALVVAAVLAVVAATVPAAAAASDAPPGPALPAVDDQLAAIAEEKDRRSETESKLDSNLLYAVREASGEPAVEGAPELRSTVDAPGGQVEVDIDARVGDRLLSSITDAGGEVVASAPAYGSVRARLALDALAGLAADPAVRGIRPADQATTNQAGDALNEADVTHGVDEARTTYGVDGSGVKVCVLSDGVDSLASSQASGDLPAVDVLGGQAGTGDEGTAMLELIHDLAPGAELGFATGFTGLAPFAQNIVDLERDGCQVIVDDVTYFAEPTFQDGIVAQAITTVRNAGAVYFTSAGNSGNLPDGTSGTWQGDFQDAGPSAAPLAAGKRLHGWGQGVPYNTVLAAAGPLNLQWADPLGGSANDYDLYVLDPEGTSVVASSTNVQNGSQHPVESVGAPLVGERVVVAKASGATDRFLVLYSNRGRLAVGTGGSARGHNVSVDAISVGATPASVALAGGPTGPYPERHSSADVSQLFSSDGPTRQYFTPAGVAITPGNFGATGGVGRNGLDITAADGVTTTVSGFERFYGTSAAAPNVAAIAALGLQARPGSTPAQVEGALVASAIDIEAPGVDPVTGAGVVMAQPFLSALGATPRARVVADGLTVSPAGDGDPYLEPGESATVVQGLRNLGGAIASGVTATLTSPSPHVVVTQPSVSYPSMAPGATAAPGGPPLAFSVAADCPCGATVPFTLTVAFDGGNEPTVEIPLAVAIGGPGPMVEVPYVGAATPIPDSDPGGVAVAVDVSTSSPIRTLSVTIGGTACSVAAGATTVGIDHTYVEDLRVTLTSPQGTTVTLFDGIGGSGNNLCGTVLADDAGTPIQTATAAAAPFTGRFRPANALTAFAGEDPMGTWTLRAVDRQVSDTGSIRAFSLGIETFACGPSAAQQAYVGAVYRDFLDREADPSGAAYWAGRLERGVETRASFVRKMARSPEYARKVVTRTFVDVLGREPDPSGAAYWSNRVMAGMAPSTLTLNLIASNEFLAATGGSVGGFVDALYQAVLGRAPDPGGRAYAVKVIEAGRARLTVAAEVYRSSESRRRRARTLYDLLLRRPPTAAELDAAIVLLVTGTDTDLAIVLASTQEYVDAAS